VGEEPGAGLAATAAVSCSGPRVAAGFVGVETSAFAAPPIAVATTGLAAGVSGLLTAGPRAAVGLVVLGLTTGGAGVTSDSSIAIGGELGSFEGGLLPLPSGGLLPRVPSTRMAAPHDLHLIVTSFPRTLRV